MSGFPTKSNIVALVWRWQRLARWRQLLVHRGRPLWIGTTVTALLIPMGVTVLIWVARHATTLIATMQAYPLALIGACATPVCFMAMRSRRRLALELANPFLATLPIPPAQSRRAVAIAVSFRAAAALLVLALPLGLALSVSDCDVRTYVTLLSCVALGVIGGGLLGWRLAFSARERARIRPAESTLRWRSGFSGRHGMAALGHWPMLQARRDTDPAFHVRVLLPILLTMPAGIPLPVTLAIMSGFVALLAAYEWFRAARQVLPLALHWLRSLPVPIPQLAIRLSLRCACWYGSAIVGAGMVSMYLGLSPGAVAIFALCALFAFVLACVLACLQPATT